MINLDFRKICPKRKNKDRIILNYLGYYEHITKRKVEKLLGISNEDEAKMLHKMQSNNLIKCSGKGRGAEYTL